MKINDIPKDKWVRYKYVSFYNDKLAFDFKAFNGYIVNYSISLENAKLYGSYNHANIERMTGEDIMSCNHLIHNIKCRKSGNFMLEHVSYSAALDTLIGLINE